MSQYDFGNLSSPLPGATFIDDNLEPWRDALYSMHKGSSQPSYIVQGLQWIDDSVNPWLLKIYDGASNITLGTLNPSTHVFTPSIPDGAITSSKLNASAISGQTEATIASGDYIVFSDTDDSGALKKDTVQGITNVTKDYLFDQASDTLDGTELVSVEKSGTVKTVMTQDIADLASGGGITITPQTLIGTTLALISGYPLYFKSFQITDGKILLARNTTEKNIALQIIEFNTDGTIAETGAVTNLTDSTDDIYVNEGLNVLVLNSTQLIIIYQSNTDTKNKAILATYDISTNTISSLGTAVDLNAAAADAYARGNDIKKINDTTAVVAYVGTSTTDSYVYGRVLTVSGSTLTANAEANLIVDGAWQQNYFPSIVYDDDSSTWFVYAANIDTTFGIASNSFTISGTAITAGAAAGYYRSNSVYPAWTGLSNMYGFNVVKKGDSFIAYMYDSAIFKIRKFINNSKGVNKKYIIQQASYTEEDIGINFYYRTNYSYKHYAENDNYIFLIGLDENHNIIALAKDTNNTSKVLALSPDYLGANNLYSSGVTKIRDNQYVANFVETSTAYVYFQPFTIEE